MPGGLDPAGHRISERIVSRQAHKSTVKYNSTNQHCFIQQSPRFYCRYARRFAQISEIKGFPVKCRDSRCSQACRNAWQQKHGACLARLLSELPGDCLELYRGNLTLPPAASPDDHKRVKKEFLRIINRWKQGHGYAVEIHAVLHPTDPLNAHWDIVAYTNSPAKPFRKALADAWVRAGGRRCTRVALDGTELDAWARYTAKTTKVDREDHLLLAPQSECGIDGIWSTRGFWQGKTVDQIWSTLLAEWFPSQDDDEQLELAFIVAQRRAERGIGPIEDRDIRAKPKPDPAPPAPYIPGDDVDLDAARFARHLPTDPGSAVGVSHYATRWGVDADYMLSVLRKIPRARCLDGWQNPSTGNCVYNAWYIELIGTNEQNFN